MEHISFLISTPQTGEGSILATFSLLGVPFAIIRPLAALITGITGGVITGNVTPSETENTPYHERREVEKSLIQKIKEVFTYGFVECIHDTSKRGGIGVGLAALISALIPDDFSEILNLSPILQMINDSLWCQFHCTSVPPEQFHQQQH